MQIIFEEDIEKCDFFEIILSPREYDILLEKGIVKEFPNGLFRNRGLNIYLRVEP
jgi:hypothetical protein